MKRFAKLTMSALLGISLTATGLAAETETSANASSRWGRPGDAGATARYEGDVGFARTEARSGRVSTARGVAVGADEHGVSLSISNAVATPLGAVGTTFNLSIGPDGVSASRGAAVSVGGRERGVAVGGATDSRGVRPAQAISRGFTRGGGVVRATSDARDDIRPRSVRVLRRFGR